MMEHAKAKKNARRKKAILAARHREAHFPQENVLDCDPQPALVNDKIMKFSDLQLLGSNP